MLYKVSPIDYDATKAWILKIHYAKRMPSISYAFGLFDVKNVMVGVVTYGIPASPFLCKGVCGPDWKDKVIELNRLVLLNNKKNEASILISRSLKLLPPPLVVVSYADTKYNHVGYVYQATNWIYTGLTKERTDMLSDSGHSRHNNGNPKHRQGRSAKHRYVYFVGDKRQKSQMKNDLRYEVYEYPKGESRNYQVEKDSISAQMLLL